MLTKKQSKVEVMNISFELPREVVPLKYRELNSGFRDFYKTDYHSSLKICQVVKANDVVYVNLPSKELFREYQRDTSKFRTDSRMLILDSNERRFCYLSYNNELVLHKMNYLP